MGIFFICPIRALGDMRKSHVSARMKYVSFDESACFVSRYEKPPLHQMEFFLFIQKNKSFTPKKEICILGLLERR
jgi:hypothetical protein